MEPAIATTANQAWKKYKNQGGTLSFCEFVTRQKQKAFSANGEADGMFMVNPSANDTIQHAINNMLKEGGLKEKQTGKTVFGVPKPVVIGVAGLLVGVIIFVIVKKSST